MSLSRLVLQRDAATLLAPWSRIRVIRSTLTIGLLALIFRLFHLGQFVTRDEINFWLRRSDAFWRALINGDPAATAISVHPGVTTMWLGGMGLWVFDRLHAAGLVLDTFAARLGFAQFPVALVHALLVVVGYRLLCRMLPSITAAVAAIFWAIDPFAIAFSRVLHTDGLLMSFGMISLLAACVYWHHLPRTRWLVLSAAAAAAAVLSKSPGILLLPFIMGMAVIAGVQRVRAEQADGTASRRLAWRYVLLPIMVWLVIFIMTSLALWPALWAAPERVIDLLRFGVENEGAQPHMLGNYFLGREEAAPGWLFYPVALALRTTPLTLIGLLVLPLIWRKVPTVSRRDLLVLVVFVILFTVAMSLFPKKFNRYLVPVFPAIDILAAIGLTMLINWLRQSIWWVRFLLVAAIVYTASWHPYTIAAFNPLLGGPRAGAYAFSIGWGEGMDQVAAWLNQQDDITGVLTLSTATDTLQPYLRDGAQSVTPQGQLLPKSGYVVIYVRDAQGTLGPPFDLFYRYMRPIETIRIHGVEYARIYQVPPQIATVLLADFGDLVRLAGFTRTSPIMPGRDLNLRLVWRVYEAPGRDYTIFGHVLNAAGERVAQVDIPQPMHRWQAGRFVQTELRVPLPPDLPPGTYILALGLYDPASGQRLHLDVPVFRRMPEAGPDAVRVLSFDVEEQLVGMVDW